MNAHTTPAEPLRERLERRNDQFLPNLDLLRSLAVLLVVFDHTSFAFGRETIGGWYVGRVGLTGVYLFFVHTCLVLLWSLDRKPYTLDFYIRRIFRIYPLAIAGTLIALFTRAPLSRGIIPYLYFVHADKHTILANLALVQNLVNPTRDYHSILHVEWTLPWEVQMYLLLPILYAFVRREVGFLTIGLTWALAVQFDLYSHITPLSFAGSVPNFLGGVMAYVAYRRYGPKMPAWFFVVFLLTLIGCLAHTGDLEFSWVFTAIIGCSLPLFHQFKASPFTRACNLIARYSFGIYLSHPFALWIVTGILPLHRVWVQIVVGILLTAVFSVVGYHLLEKPMIRLGAKLAADLEVWMQKRGTLRAI